MNVGEETNKADVQDSADLARHTHGNNWPSSLFLNCSWPDMEPHHPVFRYYMKLDRFHNEVEAVRTAQ